jgi:hypothetical protein
MQIDARPEIKEEFNKVAKAYLKQKRAGKNKKDKSK